MSYVQVCMSFYAGFGKNEKKCGKVLTAMLQGLKIFRAEQSRAEQSRAEQSRAEQSRAEQSRAEQSRAESGMGCSRDTVFFTGCFLLCRKTLREAACKMVGAVENPDGSHGNPV